MKYFGLGKTHVGLIRTNNEDSFFVSNDTIGGLNNLFIVADGMGGHNAGEIASSESIKFYVDYLTKPFNKTSNRTEYPDVMMADAVKHANDEVYKLASQNISYTGMGTTFSSATINDGVLYFAHIGDSRIYRINDSSINLISEDHSFVYEMVRLGELTETEARVHPKRNLITRALGTENCPQVNSGYVNIEESDKILICSDGLTNLLEDSEIMEIVNRKETMTDRASNLINRALEGGGHDNITVVLVEHISNSSDDGIEEIMKRGESV